jgi:CheY-like chemotaxis protein
MTRAPTFVAEFCLSVLRVSSLKSALYDQCNFSAPRDPTGGDRKGRQALVSQRGEAVDRARILLADDHEEMRDLVKRVLEHEFEVLDSVENGFELLKAAAKLKPDVCLLDISMPVLSGIEAATQLKESCSTAKIVFLTIHEDLEYVQAALRTGASGYVVKRELVTDLRSAIREALAGRIFISSSLVFGKEPEQKGEVP